MEDLLTDLIDAASREADYADARFVHRLEERAGLRNGALEMLDREEQRGFGVRVRVGGAWGFAAVHGDDRAAGELALARALATARAQPRGPAGELAPEPPARGAYSSPCGIDPFTVPTEEKLALLGEAEAGLRAEPAVKVARAFAGARREERLLVTSEGTFCHQVLTDCGGGLEANAVGAGGTQVRSYPGSHSGSVAQAGWEHVVDLDLAGHAPRVAAEAAALLGAPPCPAATQPLILAGEQLAMQIHESVGHATELDRVLGAEASYAGTSWLTAAGLGSTAVGSELMSISADATVGGGLGSYAWDDEGVAGQSIPIVRDGILSGFLSSRETAAEIGLPRSGGCMRADGFARQPIVRMTNVSLDPGAAGSLEDLIADTERAILIDTNRSWSIDSRRLHFQFGGEAAWEIVDGERGRLLRDPVYAGVTPTFWAGLDAVCSQSDWRLHSVTTCGKGEPGQYAHVSHGCAPARFREARLGSG